MAVADPDYYAIISRKTVEALAQGTDNVAIWAQQMLASTDEEAMFLRGARVFFERSAQTKRRKALAALARTFRADRHELKRYLRFKGLVNLMD